MPINRLVAKEEIKTYAAVLLENVYKVGGEEAVFETRNQLEQIARYMRTSVELRDALSDPGYTTEQRSELVQRTFSDLGFNPVMVEVLKVMAERGDFNFIIRVKDSYNEQLEQKLDIAVIDVTTTVTLDDQLRQTIIQKFKSDLGTKVVLREHIDKSILGGIIMSVHGKRIDASVLSQLESARNVLKLSTDGGEC